MCGLRLKVWPLILGCLGPRQPGVEAALRRIAGDTGFYDYERDIARSFLGLPRAVDR